MSSKKKVQRTPRAGRSRRAIFTIASNNYIPFATTLMASILSAGNNDDRFVIISDTPCDIDVSGVPAKIIYAADLGIRLFSSMVLWYDILELNTSLKPYVFQYLFCNEYDEIIYFDPDILVSASLSTLWDRFQNASCLLTPHHMKPLQDGFDPDDLAILRSGVYNLGFVGFKKSCETDTFLAWWADRLTLDCRVDVELGIFTDQRWMDLAPAFIADLCIIRGSGYNLAYWNIAQRKVSRSSDGVVYVDGEILVFTHFSGLDPEQPFEFSKHQNRLTLNLLPEPLIDVCEKYCKLVLDNNWSEWRSVPYGYGYFATGRAIEKPMRRWIIRNVKSLALNPESIAGLDPLYFDDAESGDASNSVLTRTAYQLWLDRVDLKMKFDITTPQGCSEFTKWVLGGGGLECGLSEESVTALGRLIDPNYQPLTCPWPSVRQDLWSGPSKDVDRFLGEAINFTIEGVCRTIPRSVALAWESRADLRSSFPLVNDTQLLELLSWGLTYGVLEGAILASGWSDRVVDFLSLEDAVGLDDEFPLTRSFVLTSNVSVGRNALPQLVGFPTAKVARVSHAIWYSYVAPDLFGWSAHINERVRSWLSVRTELLLVGFRANRATMALWWLRKDIQELFSLLTDGACANYIWWLINDGLHEIGVDIAEFDSEMYLWLRKPSENLPALSNVAWLLWRYIRNDLPKHFDVFSASGLLGYQNWLDSVLLLEYPRISSLVTSRTDLDVELVVIGTWKRTTGVGEHVRSTAAALLCCDYQDFVILDIDDGQIYMPDGTPIPHAQTINCHVSILHLNADTAREDWQKTRKLGVRSDHTIGWWAWELEVFPKAWLAAFNYVDEVWAVSQFTENALKPVTTRKLRTVLQAITLPAGLEPSTLEDTTDDSRGTVFMMVFDPNSFIERKNPMGVIKAFLSAFPLGSEAVKLIIKSHGDEKTLKNFEQVRREVTDGRLTFVHEDMPRVEFFKLLRSADCYVSLHRSEGFGRVPAEAMLLGMPVILTDYSGTSDYADENCSLLVPFRKVKLRATDYVQFEGQQWAEPDLRVAQQHMQWVHSNRSGAKALGMRARGKIMELLSLQRVGEDIINILASQSNIGEPNG